MEEVEDIVFVFVFGLEFVRAGNACEGSDLGVTERSRKAEEAEQIGSRLYTNRQGGPSAEHKVSD
jgi:hypothetical protein